MKKLLVLALVVSLAGLASAGLSWTVVGSTATTGNPMDVMPGDTLELVLTLVDDTASAASIDLFTDNGADGGFTGATVPAEWPTNSGILGDRAGAPASEIKAAGVTINAADDDWAYMRALGSDANAQISGDLISLLYTAGSEGVVSITTATVDELGATNYIGLVDGGLTAPPALELNVIPEPMTVALLGLGGLFLRRRK